MREGISALEAEGHTWRFPEIGEAYRKVETAKKAKKYPTETTYTDDQGLQAFRKVDGTAIGTLINFRNKYLGHGVPLNREQCAELYAHYKPILDDFLQGLVFAPDLTLVRAERTHLFRLTGTAPEEVDGRQPTVAEREKVWVEHSDGRRMELMPFFILPGQVAGVGVESGVLVYEQFTGGKRLVFHGPDSSHGESVGEVLERLKSMIRLKEEEPPKKHTQEWVQVDEGKALSEILAEPGHVLPGLPVFHALVPGTPFHAEFFHSQHCRGFAP